MEILSKTKLNNSSRKELLELVTNWQTFYKNLENVKPEEPVIKETVKIVETTVTPEFPSTEIKNILDQFLETNKPTYGKPGMPPSVALNQIEEQWTKRKK